jgi:hypothetical protein
LLVGAALIEPRAKTAELSELRAAVAQFGGRLVPRCTHRLMECEISAWEQLGEAAHVGDASRVAELLARPTVDFRPEMREQRQWFDNCALRNAAQRGRTACVELLAPRAADDTWGQDHLMAAAANGHAECVAVLLPWANPLRIPKRGQTALMLAADFGSGECVRLLLPHSDAAAFDENGDTALILATRHNHPDCVAALLPASDPNTRKRLGDTAMAIAIRRGHAECADLMAPRAEREAVEEAFRKFGPAGMPRWHAQIEAKALRETLRGCASNEAHTNHGAGLCSGGEPRVGDQTPQRTRPRGAAKRL